MENWLSWVLNGFPAKMFCERYNIQVQLFSGLQIDRFEKETIKLKKGSTVHELLRKLNINMEEVGALVVNRRSETFTYVLKEGDFVTIIPPIYGG